MPAVARLTLDLVSAAARDVAEEHGLNLVLPFDSAARERSAAAADVDLAVVGGA